MFIDFEGIDGSGKTTLSNALADRLEGRGLKVTHARAGGELRSALARRVRPLTRDAQLLEMSARAEFFLNLAREAQQIDEVVRPALARGDICITDRSLYSQIALSAGGRGLEERPLRAAAELAGQGLWPDLVLLIDVDPDLARMRKRASKIRDGIVEEESGRKGLSGHGLLVRVRTQFLRMAAAEPERFVVVRNEGRALAMVVDEIVDVVTARLSGRPTRMDAAQPPPAAPAPVRDLEQACFAAIDELARREPWVAVHLLTGIPGRAAHARRMQHAQAWPRNVAASLAELRDPPSFELRAVLAPVAPAEVAASLRSDPGEPAMVLRGLLFERAPAPVLAGLSRNASAEAWALREQALERGWLERVLPGLAGLEGERAWNARERGIRAGLHGPVARSLSGLGGERADAMREALFPVARLEVLASTRGLNTPFAQRAREELAPVAPKPVLRSLEGIGAAYADALRVQLAQLTKEALDSVEGSDADLAWSLRERYLPVWPAAAVMSLRGLALQPRAQRLISLAVSSFPGSLAVLRAAYFVVARAMQAQARPAAPEAAAGPELRLGA
ncbi:MAG: dTMP kinase [Deltaproteobacteria bacterium]|nr:MAG: dTMP kinase [Deltaproteobacteria bacterium]